MSDKTGTDHERAQALQRFMDYIEARPAGVIDDATGLTGNDLEQVLKLAMSAQSANVVEDMIADIETGTPEDLAHLTANAILATMSMVNQKVTGDAGIMPGVAIDSLVQTLALIVASQPELESPKALREELEDFTSAVKASVKNVRKLRDETGFSIVTAARRTVN